MAFIKQSSGLVTVGLKTQSLISWYSQVGWVDSSFITVPLQENFIFLVFRRRKAEIPRNLGIGETFMCKPRRSISQKEDTEIPEDCAVYIPLLCLKGSFFLISAKSITGLGSLQNNYPPCVSLSIRLL